MALSCCSRTAPQSAPEEYRLHAIEQRLTSLEDAARADRVQLGATYRKASDVQADVDDLRKTVTSNARAANWNSLRDMTSRGACGTEIYYDDSGVPRQRYRECKRSDLRQ